MEMIQEERPPAYSDHSPEQIVLPSVPRHDLPHNANAPLSLPDLKSLGLPPRQAAASQSSHWHTPSNGSFSYTHNAPNTLPPPSPMATESVMSDSSRYRAPSHVSLDDPETREAAEALSVLRNMDFHRSPPAVNAAKLPTKSDISVQLVEPENDSQEPLLSLITSNHPWIGGTISTSLYAYNSTMHYSPAFVQSFIERNVSSVANGIGSVGRVTGVESRVRQYLGETPGSGRVNSHKRQREASPDDVEMGLSSPPQSRHRSRTSSQASFPETLPAYDENRAPAYEITHSQLATSSRRPSQAWSTRLMITTSGLGVALSDTSLRSLKYCLHFLTQASSHLTEIMAALRSLIAEYEQTVYGSSSDEGTPRSAGPHLTPQQEAASQQIVERIKSLGNEIRNTLQAVTSTVSKYSGAALPENAGALVRRQLLSIPQRWKVAEETSAAAATTTPTDARRGNEASSLGQKLLLFAEQGCDMVAQVSLVVGGTVDSAEKWLESMGRNGRRRSVAGPKASPFQPIGERGEAMEGVVAEKR